MNKWIKCSERMPPENQKVLAIVLAGWGDDNKHKTTEMHVITWADKWGGCFKIPTMMWKLECGCSGLEHDEEQFEAVYWMPLPKSPEVE